MLAPEETCLTYDVLVDFSFPISLCLQSRKTSFEAALNLRKLPNSDRPFSLGEKPGMCTMLNNSIEYRNW